MKFTKEQAFEKLKSLLTNDGKKPLRMSEQSINKQLETLMPLIASDETELDDFVEKVKPTFETMNGNAEHDQSAFVEDWKQKHPEQKPPQTQQPPQTQSEEYKALEARVKAMEEEKKANDTKAAIAAKKSSLLDKLKEKGIKDKEWCEAMVNEISLDENTDVDAKATSLLNLYNKNKSSYSIQTPASPTSGNPNQDEFADVKAARKEQLGIKDGQ